MSVKPMSYPLMEKLVALTRRRGFLFQSSEIYDGINAVYDYGPMGVELKRNVKNLWWKEMITSREDVLGMDTAILMHPRVWEASGHVVNFHDPMINAVIVWIIYPKIRQNAPNVRANWQNPSNLT